MTRQRAMKTINRLSGWLECWREIFLNCESLRKRVEWRAKNPGFFFVCGRSMAQIIVLKERDDDTFMCTGAEERKSQVQFWCERGWGEGGDYWSQLLLPGTVGSSITTNTHTHIHVHSFMQMTWKPFKSCHSNFSILFELLSARGNEIRAHWKLFFTSRSLVELKRRSARWMWKVFIRFATLFDLRSLEQTIVTVKKTPNTSHSARGHANHRFGIEADHNFASVENSWKLQLSRENFNSQKRARQVHQHLNCPTAHTEMLQH